MNQRMGSQDCGESRQLAGGRHQDCGASDANGTVVEFVDERSESGTREARGVAGALLYVQFPGGQIQFGGIVVGLLCSHRVRFDDCDAQTSQNLESAGRSGDDDNGSPSGMN